MGRALNRARAGEARAAIAVLLAHDSHATETLGTIVLHDHQRSAAVRIRAALTEFRGALLADVTGLGKTYVALAVARDARAPIIVAPAALREMWRAAMADAGVRMPFVSIESLSRQRPETATEAAVNDLVIVDEAHHARNPATARYRALATLTQRATVLLLSATPIHNSEADLRALLALFLGARAATIDIETAMRCVIRRTAGDSRVRLPRVEGSRRLPIADDEERMRSIIALPPPTPPSDGGDGGILLVYSLLRRWASSQAALAESLRRRLARATALLDALETGRYPSQRELSAWSYADGAMQLAFPELTASAAPGALPAAGLCDGIRIHAAAVRVLLDDLRNGDDIDARRAAHLGGVRASHPGEKIVAFTQYAETVSSLFAHLRNVPGVAALTAGGGRVAGGTLTRTEALERFAPAAHGSRAAGSARAIDLLLTTDLLSEGVNLQDASVVVHVDLPWTPARLEQRVGRVARIGSRHDRVAVYEMEPPVSAERLVRVEERLRAKLAVSARAVGIAGTILPPLAFDHCATPVVSPPEWAERIAARAAMWSDASAQLAPLPVVAAVVSPVSGLLAVIRDNGGPRLVATDGLEVTDDPRVVLRMMAHANGADAPVDAGAVERACAALRRWRASRHNRRDVTLDGALHARARRAVVDRIAAIARRAPRHLRPGIVALAATARHTVSARYGVGAERVLDELAAARMPDEAWLRAIGTFGEIHDPAAARSRARDAEPWLVVMVLLVALPAAET